MLLLLPQEKCDVLKQETPSQVLLSASGRLSAFHSTHTAPLSQLCHTFTEQKSLPDHCYLQTFISRLSIRCGSLSTLAAIFVWRFINKLITCSTFPLGQVNQQGKCLTNVPRVAAVHTILKVFEIRSQRTSLLRTRESAYYLRQTNSVLSTAPNPIPTSLISSCHYFQPGYCSFSDLTVPTIQILGSAPIACKTKHTTQPF